MTDRLADWLADWLTSTSTHSLVERAYMDRLNRFVWLLWLSFFIIVNETSHCSRHRFLTTSSPRFTPLTCSSLLYGCCINKLLIIVWTVLYSTLKFMCVLTTKLELRRVQQAIPSIICINVTVNILMVPLESVIFTALTSTSELQFVTLLCSN